MSVLDSIKEALGSQPKEDAVSGHYRCEFCDSDFETAYSFCPDCGSERVQETD